MRLAALALLAGCAIRGPASAPDAVDATCVYSARPITVDAIDGERVWRRAPVIPLRGFPEAAATEARCAWTDDGIALFARMTDRNLRAAVTERDGRTWDDDVIEWFLEPVPGGDYVEAHVTPLGTTLDLRLPRGEGPEAPLDLRAAVALDGTLSPGDEDTGWVAELWLTWSQLPGPRPTRGTVWRSHVARYDYPDAGRPQLSSSAPFTEVDFHRRHEWPTLTFTR